MAWTGEGMGAPSGAQEGEDWGRTCRLDRPGPLSTACAGDSNLATETFHSSLFMGLQGAALGWKCTYIIGAITRGGGFSVNSRRLGWADVATCLSASPSWPGDTKLHHPLLGGPWVSCPPAFPASFSGSVPRHACSESRTAVSAPPPDKPGSDPPPQSRGPFQGRRRPSSSVLLQVWGEQRQVPPETWAWRGPSRIRDPCWGTVASPPPRWALEKCSQGWNCALASPQRGQLPNALPAAGAVLQERGKMIANMS